MKIIPLEDIRASNTSINAHRKCPTAWAYEFARGLERNEGEVSAPLDFGNWWHAIRAADMIDKGRDLGSIRYIPPTLKTAVKDDEIPTDYNAHVTLVDTVWMYVDAWWTHLSPGVKDELTEALGDPVPDRLRYVDARWRERWEASTKHERPLAVEMPWKRKVPKIKVGDETLETRLPMEGIIDALYFDARRGMIVMRDAKSHKALSSYSQVDEMLDSQLQLYAWAAAPLVKEWDLGPIRAIEYDRVRMVAPKEPAVTASGNLAKTPSDYDAFTYWRWATEDTRPTDDEIVAIAEERQPDSPEGQAALIVAIDEVLDRPGRVWGKVGEFFVTGAKKGQPKFGIYEPDPKVAASLKTPDALDSWFRRTLTPLNPNIVAAHLRANVDTSAAIEVTHRRLGVTGEAPRNFGRNCLWCPFSALCKAEMVGGVSGEYDLDAMGLRVRPDRDPNRS